MWTLINKHPPITIYLLGTFGTVLPRLKGWRRVDRTIIPTIKIYISLSKFMQIIDEHETTKKAGLLTQQYPSPIA